MRKFLLSLILLVFSIGLMSCGQSTPKCSDKIVQDLVKEIMAKQVIVPLMVADSLSKTKSFWFLANGITKDNVEEFIQKLSGVLVDGKIDGQPLTPQQQKDVEALVNYYASKDFQSLSDKDTYVLENFRCEDKNDKAHKVICIADLKRKGNQKKIFSVAYQANSTEDGKIYVSIIEYQ